jgi:tetraacyldisaccharide 4'-kinase
VKYGELLNFTIVVEKIKKVLVVSGIANPTDMIEHLSTSYLVEPILFSDHHEFTQVEINKIHRKFDTFVTSESAIVTTQKDFMRLRDKIEKWGMVKYPWYILPISIEIENEIEFNKLIFDYVGKN